MEYKGIKTFIGRILSEVSWSGKSVKAYREGGAGFENVLTAEIFQLLNYLPREHFLKHVLKRVKLLDGKTYKLSTDTYENLSIDILPGNYYLKNNFNSHQSGMSVQPDGFIEDEHNVIMLEAKRLKRSSFQPQQLAKEFYLLNSIKEDKVPLLLLILGKNPPVFIKGKGNKDIYQDIIEELDEVYEHAETGHTEIDALKKTIKQTVGWITWNEIYAICQEQLQKVSFDDDSIKVSIERIIQDMQRILERHM